MLVCPWLIKLRLMRLKLQKIKWVQYFPSVSSCRFRRLLAVRVGAPVLLLLTSTSAASASVGFSVCFDFACKTRQEVSLTSEEWRQVEAPFLLNANAWEERERIRDAVALLESLVGLYTPTHRDVARNIPPGQLADLSGQMDCIDESINATTYLKLLEERSLLRFHTVTDRAYRRSLLTQHWAAQIIEVQSGRRFVIDSWFRDNGEPPFIVEGESWHDLSAF